MVTRPPTAPVLGIPLALADYDGILEWMDAAIAAGSREYVCVAATHTVMAAREDPELHAAVLGSSLTVPDGQPLVWALRAYGHELGDRVYGPTLMEQACARAARTGARPTHHEPCAATESSAASGAPVTRLVPTPKMSMGAPCWRRLRITNSSS